MPLPLHRLGAIFPEAAGRRPGKGVDQQLPLPPGPVFAGPPQHGRDPRRGEGAPRRSRGGSPLPGHPWGTPAELPRCGWDPRLRGGRPAAPGEGPHPWDIAHGAPPARLGPALREGRLAAPAAPSDYSRHGRARAERCAWRPAAPGRAGSGGPARGTTALLEKEWPPRSEPNDNFVYKVNLQGLE
ncbi:uncharacterized protein LOC129118729 isoform X1 [Agelaius phoeniceus]|uniref:translation initiation factor IF-2-like isoform X2 n=1 Tax=Agelaius phoeniceus TaxID=39638 RepID=UPI0023ECB578|nr:translation initiation factor IF-2-like isoform X2 [Agelaius phoeniceus]XP_054486259.1 translation initiation factor IF-2-like isoform X2 [Agelaius phoeniceus]